MSKLSMPLKEYSHILKVEKGLSIVFTMQPAFIWSSRGSSFRGILEHPLKFRILFRDWFLGGPGLTSNSQAYH